MGFLDNSGDIILDAVLTDLGRKRLAEGNGRFNISKFALADDEIDYGLYDKTHASGSAYYDLNILQTPVLESFTNNMSSMKSRLLSIARKDLLYLPVIKIFNQDASTRNSQFNNYVVLVDETTVNSLKASGGNTLVAGQLNGNIPQQGAKHIRVDQGLDTLELSANSVINQDLLETQYFVQMDNRLGFIASPTTNANTNSSLSFTPTTIDDDNIATYIFTLNDGSDVVSRVAEGDASSIKGPRGTKVSFKIGSSLDAKTSSYLFTQLGSTGTTAITGEGSLTLAAGAYKFIDSTVRISGVSTGYTLDVPIRLVKKN